MTIRNFTAMLVTIPRGPASSKIIGVTKLPPLVHLEIIVYRLSDHYLKP